MARGEPWALPSAADGRRKDVPPWTAGISFRMHVRCLPTPLAACPHRCRKTPLLNLPMCILVCGFIRPEARTRVYYTLVSVDGFYLRQWADGKQIPREIWGEGSTIAPVRAFRVRAPVPGHCAATLMAGTRLPKPKRMAPFAKCPQHVKSMSPRRSAA